MSKYIVLSDVHGNAPALQKVVDEEGLDAAYVVLGDIMGLNAYPAETMDLLNEMEPKVLLAGNHDKAIFHHNEGHVASDVLSKFERDHTLNNLNATQKKIMRSLTHMEVWQEGSTNIAAAHAKPWHEEASGYEQGNAGVPKGNIPHFASSVADHYDYVFVGHTHEQYDLDATRWGHPVHFVNPGSLGWDNTYSVVDTEAGIVEHKSVETDTDAIREHIQRLLPEDAPHTSEWF